MLPNERSQPNIFFCACQMRKKFKQIRIFLAFVILLGNGLKKIFLLWNDVDVPFHVAKKRLLSNFEDVSVFLCNPGQTTKCTLRNEIMCTNDRIIFLKEFWCVWSPSEYSTAYSGPVEYSTDPFLGDPQVKKSRKSISPIFSKNAPKLVWMSNFA